VRFVSERYPFLHVHDLGVRFVDGEAEVTGNRGIARLKALDPSYGVRPAGDQADHEPEGAGDPPVPPAASAAKAAWVDWAVEALGVSKSEAEAMTKAELAELASGE